MTFGEMLALLMEEREIGVRALARQVPCDAGHISKLCHGHKNPSQEMALRLDEILNAGGRLVDLARTTEKTPGQAGSVESTVFPPGEDDEMQRRRLLQALAALGVASSPAVEAVQRIREGVDYAIGRDESSHLDEWEETVAEYGYSYVLAPPQALLRDLAIDLVTLQLVISRRAEGQIPPAWCRVTGGLAALMAKTLCNLGQTRLAREWWTTAQHAADASHDTDLALWVRGEQIVHGLYEGRPATVLLRKADRAIGRASGGMSRGLLHVRTVRAQLLALEGAAQEATTELKACEELFTHLPASVTSEIRSVAGWAEDRLRYTEAWVYAHTAECGALDAAVVRARQVLPEDDPRVGAQLELLRAAGHVRAGDITEGVRHAHAVYGAQPDEHRTVMVTSLARQVEQAVLPRHRTDPIVVDYAELLSSDVERRAIT